MKNSNAARVASLSLLACVLLVGCSAARLHQTGLDEISRGHPEEGVRALEAASLADPEDAQYKADYLNLREREVQRLVASAEQALAKDAFDEADAGFARVLRIDGVNRRALDGIARSAAGRRSRPALEQGQAALKAAAPDVAQKLATDLLQANPANGAAQDLLRQAAHLQTNGTLEPVRLDASLRKPISLQFKDASLRVVLDGMARATGVDFVVDKDVRPDLRTTVSLHQTPLDDALALVLQSNGLEQKVLGPRSILIYANTPEKTKEYRELVVKGFYLANADVKQTQNLIKSMLKTKDTFVDEKLNLLVIRDTPEAIRLAEKLIAMHDLAEPEVMLDVEVLEAKRSRLNELGIQWSNQFSVTPLTGSPATLADLKGLNSSRLGITVPSATVNLRRDLGDANILANPRIRARNREKAKIMIGDKLPVTTNTATATGLVSESVQYLDVGIKLEAEPNIYLHGDVAIRVGLEVSTVVNEVRTPGGSLAYQIGSRSASTVLRLKDGETQILAGLISDEDRRDASRIPALGDLPLIGRLFGRQKDDHQKTEIVLSITPHLVRNLERPEPEAGEFWSGTEAVLSTRPVRLGDADGKGAAADASAPRSATPSLASQQAPSAIAFAWDAPAVAHVGQPVKVALRMKADGGVRGLPLQLAFDPRQLEVTDIAEGEYFRKDGGQTSLSHNVDSERGRAMVSIVRAGTDGVKGDDAVVVVSFKPRQAGSTSISVVAATPAVAGGSAPAASVPPPLTLRVEP